MKILALALACAALSPGCFFSRSNVNQRVEFDAMTQLVPGQSTAADVVAVLGAPNDVVQLARRSAYRYEFLVEKQTGLFLLVVGLRGVETNADRVWVFFDENDVLTHFGSTFESHHPGYGLPFVTNPD